MNSAEVADTQVNIRGINGARDAETNYALIIDGVLMTNPAALNREYSNLQQIEVLKGPQGALYGRNAAAGAIIITTAKPGDEWGGSLKGSMAQDDTYTLSGLVGGPVSTRSASVFPAISGTPTAIQQRLRRRHEPLRLDLGGRQLPSWDLASAPCGSPPTN